MSTSRKKHLKYRLLFFVIFSFHLSHFENTCLRVYWFSCSLMVAPSGIFAATMENWSELVLRCRRSVDDGSDYSVTKKGSSLPVRPVRRLGSEFLGKRAMLTMENLCSDWIFSEEVDENWLCQCIRNWDQSTLPANDQSIIMDEESPEAPASRTSLNKRGLGAILLSGKRVNKDKWNNNALNRRVMGSEFLGKRAILGSEFLGKRTLMGSEFLGKRGSSARSSNGIVKI